MLYIPYKYRGKSAFFNPLLLFLKLSAKRPVLTVELHFDGTKVSLGIKGGHAAGSSRGNCLAVGIISDVPRGKNTLH